jgi:glycosyltransferase involved in cell wall biosynthesis
MHIGYFSSIMGKAGGPAVVDKRVLEELVKLDHENRYTAYGLNDQAFDVLDIQQPNVQMRKVWPPGKWLGVAMGMTLELKRRPVDLLHATFVAPPIVPVRYIVTVGCWSQYSEPEVYPPLVRWRLIYLNNRGIANASAVFTYTEYLKEKVIERFHIDPERIFVIGPGIGEEIHRHEAAEVRAFLEKFNIRDPYILFIGTLNKRKNVHRLVQAYKQLKNEVHTRHKLVLVGELGYYAEEILEEIRNQGLENDVVLTGRLQHFELAYMYSGADLFAFPTLSEGFGLPPIEAMACGTPVIASNLTCVPEVMGGAAKLMDPYNIEDMAEAMHIGLTDNQLRASLIEKGKQRARDFSWQEAARKTLAAYKTVNEADW